MCTFGLSAVLVRMFVQFAHINRSWKMFSTIHNPVRARQRKERSVLLKESAGAGRLTGYIDLRRPENVRAWSKMRLYMQLVFADEIRGVEIFLAYSLLLMVIVIVLTGIYVVVPEILHSSGWKNTIMVVQLMMLGACGGVGTRARSACINTAVHCHHRCPRHCPLPYPPPPLLIHRLHVRISVVDDHGQRGQYQRGAGATRGRAVAGQVLDPGGVRGGVRDAGQAARSVQHAGPLAPPAG